MRVLFCLIVLFSGTVFADYPVVEEKAAFPGYVFRPDVPNQSFPAIVFLHGSEGGNGDFWDPPNFPPLPTGVDTATVRNAKHYASLGYVTYALCYFDCGTHQGFALYPPDEMVDIDIRNYVYEAFLWLKNSDWVGGKKIAVWGGSRGAELALLLSSLSEGSNTSFGTSYELPDAIVSGSPSDFVAFPFSKEQAHAVSNGLPPVWDDAKAWKFDNFDLTPGGAILTEAYTGPSLITYFENDTVWGPWINIQKIMDRYDQSGVTYWFLEHSDSANAKDDFADFEKNFAGNTRFFLKFKGDGHVRPKEENATKLYFSVINKFLAESLK